MALIKCPECGKEISDKAKACIYCGFPIAELNCVDLKEDKESKKDNIEKADLEMNESKNERTLELEVEMTSTESIDLGSECKSAEEPKISGSDKKKGATKVIIFCVLVMAVVVVGIFYYIKVGKPKKIEAQNRATYEEAKYLIEEEQYEEASILLSKIEDYEDSKQLYEDCLLGIINQHIENNEKDFLTEDLKYLQELEATSDIQNLMDRSNWILCKEAYEEEKYEMAISYYNSIVDESILEQENDKEEILNECAYNYAIESYENGYFDVALIYFNKLTIESEEIQDYIEKANFYSKLQGKWLSADGYSGLEYDGWDVTGYSGLVDYKGNPTNPSVFKSTSLHDYIIIDERSWYFNEYLSFHFLSDTEFVRSSKDLDYSVIFSRVDKFHDEVPEKKEPQIGMTAEEVEESTWGSPEKIHKHTYAWGVQEQWCYSGYRYIYFEGGIVTSISE